MTYLVPRFYDVTEGAVLIDGLDVRDVTMDSLAQTVGMVTQEPYLFHGTFYDNIAYAEAGATQAEVHQAARDANIHDRIMSFEDGYDTVTGERGYRLSGGEKQRLAIARVFLMDPRVLILDEATSALDTETERLVQDALERATQRPDHDRHRPPAVDHPERRRDLRSRGRRAGRAGHPRRAAGPGRAVRPALHRAVRRRPGRGPVRRRGAVHRRRDAAAATPEQGPPGTSRCLGLSG